MTDSFNSRTTLSVGDRAYEIFRLASLEDRFDIQRLPLSLKILLENLIRLEDGVSVTARDVEALAGWTRRVHRSARSPLPPAGS